MIRKYNITRLLFIYISTPALLLPGCSKLIYDVYPVPEYTGSLIWEEVSEVSAWAGRWDHALVVFKDKLWVIGGYNPGSREGDSYLEDVWYSADGSGWELATGSAPWLGRRGHAAVVFNDGSGESIYILGGFSVDESTGRRQYNNDVWKTTDGINWACIKENSVTTLQSSIDWMPRFNHRCEVMKAGNRDYIYLIAGSFMEHNSPAYTGLTYLNDVWRSADGVNWEKLDNKDFGIRSEHSTTLDHQTGKIYMQGGTYGSHDEYNAHNDKPVYRWQELWVSSDGIEWEALNDPDGFYQEYLYRAQHQIIYYEGFIWGFPGKGSTSVNFAKDPDTYAIWKYDTRGNWSVDSEGPPFTPVYGYTMLVFQGKIWLIGGHTADRGPSSAVWSGHL